MRKSTSILLCTLLVQFTSVYCQYGLDNTFEPFSCQPGHENYILGCRACARGSYSSGGNCVRCPSGTSSQEAAPNMESCFPCPDGEYVIAPIV